MPVRCTADKRPPPNHPLPERPRRHSIFTVKGIRHIIYIWRAGVSSTDKHPHLMSRQECLYDSFCLHRLQRCGYSEPYLFFLILSRIIPRGDNRRFRFRQDLILSHADNAHVSEANNIYLKNFIVLLLSVYKYLTLKYYLLQK